MSEPTDKGADGDDGFRMGRRGFIGAGLAGAGAALIPPAVANAAPGETAADEVAESARGGGPSGEPSSGGSLFQLPLRGTYPNLPAVPVDVAGIAETLVKLQIRSAQTQQAKQGLTKRFTIGGASRPAYEFLFAATTGAEQSEASQALADMAENNPEQVGGSIHEGLDDQDPAPHLGALSSPLSLEQPEQFAISWTNFPEVYEAGRPSLEEYAASLTDADAATSQFWPMIAENGNGYNLIIPERVTRAGSADLKKLFGNAWTSQAAAALRASNLYVIDMSRFEALQVQSVNGAERFTPATVTLLVRDPRSKTLTPIAIVVSGYQGRGLQRYARAKATDSAWLYALQAAKASITVYGVWLGHVYHWHIVTAAMQMTMLNTLPENHPVRLLLAPQSKFAIAFDDVLLALWSEVAPPTSLVTATEFLSLTNDYAAGRNYFDDDPKSTLKAQGLRKADFTARSAWDRYPVVQRQLQVWDMVEEYIQTFVSTTYASDAAVAGDTQLQTWLATAASTDESSGGNIRGLPETSTRAALQNVLTSLVFRITVHGISRQNRTSNPALSFTANYPHCLQRSDIPGPRSRISTRQLLTYLPNTDTISKAVTFYFTFAYSTPYESFIPQAGIAQDLFFPGGGDDARNRALIDLRRGLASFIGDYDPEMPQRYQWPRNIET
jgi:hypothetical protein